MIIAIDGPVASGKGTIAPLLAKQLQGFYLYSGAVFRCIALKCLENHVDTKQDEKKVSDIARSADISFSDDDVLLDGKNVTERIKGEDVAMASSNVGVFRAVRETMVHIMRKVAKEKVAVGIPIVTEGRDMATTVFPNAEYKIFLTAKPEIRAQRRLEQINKRENTAFTLEQVLEETLTRDKQDTERAISPLVKDPEKNGYMIIDNSHLSQEETLHDIMAKLNN